MAGTSSRGNRGADSRGWRGLKLLLLVSSLIAVLLALNAFALSNETESAAVNIAEGQLVSTTSGQIQVLDTPRLSGSTASQSGAAAAVPSAPPVVLIHGSGGAIDWWDEMIPLLSAQGRRVIAVDMLGYGGSDKPSEGYSIESQANLVAQVLSSLGVEEAVAVGHSLGGKVATALAEGSPDLIKGLAILDMPPDSSYGGLSGSAVAARLPVIGPALWRIAPDAMVRRNLSQAFAPGFGVPEKFVDDVRAMTYPAYRDSAKESESYTDQEPLDQRLLDLELPLLVIFGEQDQLYPARESLSAYAAIPGVETVLIPEAGHSPNVETPEKTAAILGRFVNSLAPEPELQLGRKNGKARPASNAKQGQKSGGPGQGPKSRGAQGESSGAKKQGRGNGRGAQPGE